MSVSEAVKLSKHSAFRVGPTTIMASDGCDNTSRCGGFSLVLSVPAEVEADRVFTALADGGQIQMPLSQTFWSPRYGIHTDRFGIGGMVMIPAEMPKANL